MKTRHALTATLLTLILGALLAAPLSAQDAGKELFLAKKCNLCHAVSSAEIEAKTKSEKLKGPDLTGVGEQQEVEWMIKYIKKEVDKEGKKHTKPFTGSDEELKALIDWLLEQKSAS